jgi:hypothetical protein
LFVGLFLEENESWEALNFNALHLVGSPVELGDDNFLVVLELLAQFFPVRSQAFAVT